MQRVGGLTVLVAVMDFEPVFLTVARASIASLLAFVMLLAFKEKRPGLLGESVSLLMVTVTIGVILCVVGSRRFAR
ncbi:hypothetical protein XBFM1_2370020 [Xenorhabdus bovienii str. feltiae Moldova]|uniref:EamA domain-containing protein n=1 Tax=Xenorhabdus bovienii str. feltiae Moldova TaxID=1398200 RepID=A0A077NTY5_XENBV|nr:hypothetical protein XBFM1_2370020 [Xenorhabdus bovienii str. feltiae Moldova]